MTCIVVVPRGVVDDSCALSRVCIPLLRMKITTYCPIFLRNTLPLVAGCTRMQPRTFH